MTAAAVAGGDDLAALDVQARAAAAALAPESPAVVVAQPDAPAAPQPSTADMLAPMVSAAFAVLAPAWGVTSDESAALAGAWAPVIDKYLPGGLALGVEMSALMATLAVLGPRFNKPRKVENKKPDAPADGGQG